MTLRSPPKLTNRRSYLKYIEVDLWSWIKDLSIQLLKINFTDNFQSFTIRDLTIPAGTEVAISNRFQNFYSGQIPSARLILRQTGDANIIDGPTAWTSKHVYLLNPSANDAIVTVIFFM